MFAELVKKLTKYIYTAFDLLIMQHLEVLSNFSPRKNPKQMFLDQ